MGQNTSTAVMSKRIMPKDGLDFVPTQPWGMRAVIEYIGKGGKGMGLFHPDDIVWEPTCGVGHLVGPLKEFFNTVHASDIFDYGMGFDTHDFLNADGLGLADPEPYGPVDWVVTNPPFKDIEQFFRAAINIARIGVVFFARIQMQEGISRHNHLWTPHQAHVVWAQFVERLPMFAGRVDESGGSATAYGVFVMDKRRVFGGLMPGNLVHFPVVLIPQCRKRLERPEDYDGPYGRDWVDPNAERVVCGDQLGLEVGP